jgi:hypothetical protein
MRILLIGLLMAASPVLARDVGGVELPEKVSREGRTLRLNGAGVRSKFFFEIYVGALYLESASSDPARILSTDQAWELTLVFKRDVDHEQVLDAFREAFEANSPPEELTALRAGLMKFHDEVMSSLIVRAGQTLTFSYRPGGGVTLTVPGGATSRVEGKAFAYAVLRTWIGDHPSDSSLKQALLGG